MLNRDKVLHVFQQALNEQPAEARTRTIRPRTIAVRAHELYCVDLLPYEKKPALVTFRKFVAGKSALPEIVAMLRDANVESAVHVRLDREKLQNVFREAVQRLEQRLMKGQARPLQIARRAYEIYTRESGAPGEPSTPQPSHHTFERLIYGKTADPEIVQLIEGALTKAKKD